MRDAGSRLLISVYLTLRYIVIVFTPVFSIVVFTPSQGPLHQCYWELDDRVDIHSYLDALEHLT